MKVITSLLLISSLLIGCSSSGDPIETQPPAAEAPEAVPAADPDPEPEEAEGPQLPTIADYGILAVKHKFTLLRTPRVWPEQNPDLKIVETKLETINGLDYLEMRAVPTDEQWVVTLFNWSSATYGSGSNTFTWPSALCMVTVEETKYLVGYRFHKLTIQMDLKFHNVGSPDSVTVETNENKLTVKLKDWEPEDPRYWKQSEDRMSLLPHDGEITVHPTKLSIYVQIIGHRLDCRMAVILVKRTDEGKILVGGGVFTYSLENGELAFPTD